LEDTHQTTNTQELFENNIYRIFQFDKSSLLLFDFHGLKEWLTQITINEELQFLRIFSGDKIDFEIMSISGGKTSFKFTFANLKEEPFTANAYVNGIRAATYRNEGFFIDAELKDVDMQAGLNSISFELEGDISKAGLLRIEIE